MSNLDRFRRWIVEDKERVGTAKSIFIVGLGRFGTALASSLVSLGVEVMAVDISQELVNEWSDRLTHVRAADATNLNTLKQLGAAEFEAAVVAIGTGIEASILTTAALVDVGVPSVWAKAISSEHGRILERVGAHHVVFPEKEMGERVAHVVTGQVVDYFQLDDGFILAEVQVPAALVGIALGDSDIRNIFNLTVVCVKPRGKRFTYATAETVLNPDDLMVIAGTPVDAERFLGTWTR
ncbi:MAG: TrkA family potassium uptake protein [Acidimicrobiales bacterium]